MTEPRAPRPSAPAPLDYKLLAAIVEDWLDAHLMSGQFCYLKGYDRGRAHVYQSEVREQLAAVRAAGVSPPDLAVPDLITLARVEGHGDGQRHTVEDIARFVEHLRDEYVSTTEPVKKIARLIREHFAVRAAGVSPRPTAEFETCPKCGVVQPCYIHAVLAEARLRENEAK